MNRQTEELWPLFIDACTSAGGTVLEVGSRVVSPGSSSKRPLFPNNQYIGMDMYPDANTDVTGDAHHLSQVVPGPLDAVFSMSVLEHLAAPWLFALEVSKVLRIGGMTFHATHFHWPEHEMPWDFFRFSDQGLSAVFCPLFGFEVVHAAVFSPARMYMVDPQLHPDMNLFQCWGGSAIVARKVSEPLISLDHVDLSLIYPAGTHYPKP